jgi:hypothetical protein
MAVVWTNRISPEAGSACRPPAGCGAWRPRRLSAASRRRCSGTAKTGAVWSMPAGAGACRADEKLVGRGAQLQRCEVDRALIGGACEDGPGALSCDEQRCRRDQHDRGSKQESQFSKGNAMPSSSACRYRWRGRASCTLHTWCRSVCRSRQAARGPAPACQA